MAVAVAPKRRQNRTMDSSPPKTNITRRNLRLDTELCKAIDTARAQRAGKVSFNTWILEAVQEKLSTEQTNSLTLVRRRNA